MREPLAMDFGLRNRVVVVTGGASGIGLAVVLAAREQGARVAVLDMSEFSIAGAAHAGPDLMARVVDVRDAAAVDAAVHLIETEFGPIRGLVACAGTSQPQPALEMTAHAWRHIIDVNLSGMFNTVQSVGRRMVARGRGAVVTISSTDAAGGHAARSHYAASKHGVIGLTRSLAIEWGRLGIRVNSVAPGVVDTPLLRRSVPTEHLHNGMIDRIPAGRLSDAAEQALPALFLLSDAASYINGATLAVDGGLTAGYFTRWSGADLGSEALLQRGVYAPPHDPEEARGQARSTGSPGDALRTTKD